ncbi:MAG: carboxypeptidase regulatory-like domain-containing protein, partial [Proteobacteria bacterium]|nr:carboxypeptidase regulatory-like domain-containing protein [Pseudomonadota bacterium]
LIDTGWVSFYILRDDATDLDKTNPSLADVVNGRKWEQRFSEEAGQGSIDIDPLFFGGNGGSSRILIIDESGNWDIGDANFNVNDQYYGPPTDLSNLVSQADSDYFCNNGCSNLSDAIRMSAAGKGWFMETDINGKTFSVNFQPDDPNNVLNGGKLLGREIDISDHNWIQGSSFVTIGEYEYVVVNGSIDGVLAKGGRDLSVVTWFESGHLYHAGYFSEDAYVAGHLLETNQDLYVFFNRNMSSAGQVDGLSPVPAFEWIDSRTFKIQLGGYSDDETLTLPAASFQQTDATPLLQDWTYTISHFVTVDGTVVDSSSDPVNYAHISSSLDDLATGTNTSGDFSLATASLDPGTEYLIYVDMGCQTVGYQLSGLHPTGEQFVVDCAGGSPLVVDSAKYAVGAVTHPTASALAWTYASSETVTWNPASYSGPVSIYLLNDDSSGLDETDPALRASNVNSRYWTKRYADIANNGSLTINVSRLREQGQGFRILIVDQNGNWDISDNDFSIQLVEASYYQATGVTSPNDGTEIWYYRFPETITWDELLFWVGSVSSCWTTFRPI